MRNTIDLVAVVTGLLGPAPGRRGVKGGRLWWHCPLHEDRNPSFCVNPGKPGWHCFGCGQSGDAAALVMEVMGLTFPETVAYLARESIPARKAGPRAKTSRSQSLVPRTGTSGMPEADALALVTDAERRLWTAKGEGALAYLMGRGLTPETIRVARLGWTSKAVGVAMQPPGVVLPWFAGDRLVLVKVRPPDAWRERLPEKWRPSKYLEGYRDRALVVCYPGPAAIRPGRPVIVAEGELDTLLLGQELAEMAAVVTLGSASARPDPALRRRMLVSFPWYVATHNDPAGDKAMEGWPATAIRIRPPGTLNDWTEVRQWGVDLRRWWGEILAGAARPPLFPWDEVKALRWGPAIADPEGGIVIVRTDPEGRAARPAAIFSATSTKCSAPAEDDAPSDSQGRIP